MIRMLRTNTIPHRRASALIIVLLMICLVAMVAVSFLASMRTERSVASMHQRSVQAGLFEQFARNTAIARLQSAFAEADGKVWATQPGAFHIHDTEWKSIDLHSGVPASTSNDASVDLNRPDLEDPSILAIASGDTFTGSSTAMRVKWIYTDKDGNLSDTPSSDSVGRFAFWIDDESTRINVNTAWKSSGNGNSQPESHPSHVDLPSLGLTITQADDVESGRNAGHFFNSLEEINAKAENAGFVDSKRFNLTHYNHSPALNPFGQPKLILTTQKSRANGSSNYLRILKNEPDEYVDPGHYDNLDPALVEQTVNLIANYLRRTDWPYPGMKGKSIAEKYDPVSPVQIAVNILEYVRASESEDPIVDPIRGFLNASGDFQYDPTSNATNVIMGNSRGPRITEVGIWVSPTKVNTIDGDDYYAVKVKREMHLPENYGIEELDLRNYYYVVAFIGSTLVNKKAEVTTVSGNYILKKGGYEVIVEEARLAAPTGANSRDAIMASFRGARLSIARSKTNAQQRMELLPESGGSGMNYISYTIQPDTVGESDIHTLSVLDPSINGSRIDWVLTNPNTLGAPNTGVPSPTLHGPQQDHDGGAISTASQRFPAPGRGGIRSVAELGNVHTGVITHNNTLQGIPYRTLRFQPRSSTTSLPDWVLLDLFTAPVEATTNPLLRPEGGEGGKINLNATVAPFQDDDSELQRLLPLKAAAINRFPSPDTAVSNLTAKTPASGAAYLSASDEPYYSAAQISEVKGISDGGESSEAQLTGLVDLLTTRSGVFSIYTVGQSIRRNSSGTVNVLSEQRDRTVVEFDTSANPARWKVVYSEKL